MNRSSTRKTAGGIAGGEPSLLCQAYYGFMLGYMATLLRFDFAKSRYQAHRSRMSEVLSELGISLRLPFAHAHFREDKEWASDLASHLKVIGHPIVDFYVLGYSALFLLIEPRSKRSRIAAGAIGEIGQKYDFDHSFVIEHLTRGWDRTLQDNALVAELVGRAYDIAAVSLDGMQKQERTAFVIMPFAPPFRAQYQSFYRPSLNLAGLEAIRAWEGLTNEHYLQMVFTLMRKCGVAIADVSARHHSKYPNLNVIHEIGMNMATGNLTFLLRRNTRVELPSNLIDLPVITYHPYGKNWAQEQIVAVAEVIRAVTARLPMPRSWPK